MQLAPAWLIAALIGIAANALAIAALLHFRGMVSFAGMNWKELGKAALVGAVSGGLSYEVMRTVPLDGSRRADLLALALGTVTWAAAVAAGLWLLHSELPADLRRKKPAAFPGVAEGQAAETMATGKEP